MTKVLKENNFKIKGTKKPAPKPGVSFVPDDSDGIILSDSFYSYGGQTYTGAINHQSKIQTYRQIFLHHLVKEAVTQITSECLTSRDGKFSLKIKHKSLEGRFDERIILQINKAFEKLLQLTKYTRRGADIFKDWYVDGVIAYHMIPDQKNEKKGLVELRRIDPIALTKFKQPVKETTAEGVEVISSYKIKYLYAPTANDEFYRQYHGVGNLEIDETAIVYATSGLYDTSRLYPISHLDCCIRPVNLLIAMENFHAIYVSKYAEDKLVFYIDMGAGTETQQEKRIRAVATKLRNTVRFNSATGEFNDGKNIMDTTRDYFVPRIDGRKTTEITRLEGGAQLGETAHLQYFRDMALESLPIPKSRIKPDTPFTSGRSTEISRDEVNFQKNVDLLRQRFCSELFLPMLRTELLLKNVITEEDFAIIEHYIEFEYPADNHYAQLLDMEIMQARISAIQLVGHDPRLYYPVDKIGELVCGYSEKEMKALKKQYQEDLTFFTNVNVEQQNLQTMTTIAPEEPATDEELPINI